MKKSLLFAALFCSASISVSAQHDHGSHKNESPASTVTTKGNFKVSQLLSLYYNIKDALASDDSNKASLAAAEYVKAVNGIDYKDISEGNVHALVKDAGRISDTKDINNQRTLFADLSINMSVLAKGISLSEKVVYEQYCPMKKTYWLSSEKTIRNPYYGSSMLTCGKVTDTIQPIID